MSIAHTPHRTEDGYRCLDIRIRSLAQLFDSRDPVPFHDGSLDADAMEAVMDFAEELHEKTAFKLIFHLPAPADPHDPRAALLSSAVANHFELAAARARRRQKRESRLGRMKLLVGLVAFVLILVLAELVREIATSPLAKLIPEGLTILAWVVMWRPLDALLFDWFPYVAERRLCLRIARAPVDIRHYSA